MEQHSTPVCCWSRLQSDQKYFSNVSDSGVTFLCQEQCWGFPGLSWWIIPLAANFPFSAKCSYMHWEPASGNREALTLYRACIIDANQYLHSSKVSTWCKWNHGSSSWTVMWVTILSGSLTADGKSALCFHTITYVNALIGLQIRGN